MNIDDRLSFQLYSARKFMPIENVLAALAKLGYRNVEPYGLLLAEIDALDAALEKNGMKAPTCHVGIDMLRTEYDRILAALRRLDVKLALVPSLPPPQRPTELAGWRAFAQELSQFRRKLADDGFAMGWHNHDFEFTPTTGGTLPMNVILDTDPDLAWEADLGWIARAGQDPLAWLQTYGDRIRALHVKDIAPAGEAADEDGWADVGYGYVDWRRLLPEMKAEILVVEHDNPNDFERFAKRSRAAMQAW